MKNKFTVTLLVLEQPFLRSLMLPKRTVPGYSWKPHERCNQREWPITGWLQFIWSNQVGTIPPVDVWTILTNFTAVQVTS